MAIIKGTKYNDNDTLQVTDNFPFIGFFPILRGAAEDDFIYGFEGRDYLIGNRGNDVLDGGVGADTMEGGIGSDTYFVDNVRDVIKTEANTLLGGYDIVASTVSFSLASNGGLEELYLSGSGAINGTGNANFNTIVGNFGANRLLGLAGNDSLYGQFGNDYIDGGTGADYMDGGDGDDIYIVDNAGDITIESFDDIIGGIDTVNTKVSHTMGSGIENINLLGLAVRATGNADDNQINGNSFANRLEGLTGNDNLNGGGGADTLDGGLGADIMDGGSGNDLYTIDDLGDVASERVNNVTGGFDSVFASVSVTALGFGIEKLTLTGFENIKGNGNANDNVIYGNVGGNILKGLDGNDILNGYEGKDVLIGGIGNDTFMFSTSLLASNVDRIFGFASGIDTIQLDDGIFVNNVFGTNIIYDSVTGALSYDADGAGAGAEVQFASLVGVPIVTATDFVIV